jgi:hypothetical protein
MLKENEESHFNQYTCLSHCWGEFQPLETTTQSIAANKIRISWNELPKTFQHAITFTRLIGINHIWIDSLCIIQNDMDDWAAESAKMSSIYANAFLTIAATASQDATEGCFRTTHPEDKRKPKEFTLNHRENDSMSTFATAEIHVGPQPLLKRGWVLQERLLSQRVIYFNEYELAWQCRTKVICECGGFEPIYSPLDTLFLDDPWMMIVEPYSHLRLGKEKDKLPALSGLASTFQNRPSFLQDQLSHNKPLGEYYAGLWQRNFVDHLCWYVRDASHKRLDKYRAPTWSWASVEDGILFWAALGSPVFTAHMLSAECFRSTADPYGQVSGGYVDLRTILIPAELHFGHTSKDHIIVGGATKTGKISKEIIFKGGLDLDVVDSKFDAANTIGIACAILGIWFYRTDKDVGDLHSVLALVLEPSQPDLKSLKRIGLVRRFEMKQDDYAPFRDMVNGHQKTIRIS